MIAIFGILLTLSVNLTMIIFLATAARGSHLFRKYKKDSGILIQFRLYPLLDKLKKLERKGELPDEEVKTYHDIKRGYNIAICGFLVSLFIWLAIILYSVISDL